MISTIRNIEETDIAKILEISNQQFGLNYLLKSDIISYINQADHFGILLEKNKEIIGFSTLKIIETSDLQNYLLKSKSDIYNRLIPNEQLGLRMQTAILPQFMGNGYGKKLVKAGNNILLSKMKQIVSIVWEQNDRSNISEILKSEKFNIIETISEFWYQDSMKHKYNCRVCGQPPCTCSASLFLYQK